VQCIGCYRYYYYYYYSLSLLLIIKLYLIPFYTAASATFDLPEEFTHSSEKEDHKIQQKRFLSRSFGVVLGRG
jgi:hypothetical protein